MKCKSGPLTISQLQAKLNEFKKTHKPDTPASEFLEWLRG